MTVYFHNKNIQVTKDSYAYVYEYKRQLMSNLERFLRDSNIKHVISHGNLIEYERGRPIYHDDDIDIRINNDDISKVNLSILGRYNLKVTGSILKLLESNIYCFWHHINLIVFESDIPVVNMKIFADLVCNKTNRKPWTVYDINYDSVREIDYLGTKTFAPSKEDTLRLLEKEYGENWIIPNYTEYLLV
jgi:hypothetical protein